MRAWFLGAIGALLFTAGCKVAQEMKATLGELQTVQEQVVAAVPGTDVNVNLVNGRFLNVALVNSPLKALPADKKEARAREIALVAYRAFPSRAALQSVAVVFWVQRTYFLFFQYSDGTDYHGFSAQSLAASESPTATWEGPRAGRRLTSARSRHAGHLACLALSRGSSSCHAEVRRFCRRAAEARR